MELKRRKGLIPDDRHLMTMEFIQMISAENFLKHARHSHAIVEFARFYGVEQLESEEDLAELLSRVQVGSASHKEILYYAFYFAAWVKKEVPSFQRTFRQFDRQICLRIEDGGSLQSILRDLVTIIGYKKVRRYYETMAVNRVHIFMETKGVTCAEDLTALDDLEARHIID